MALNLSTLTNASTSGDVLAEALTTADFLEGVPVLRNLARGSQKGGDAKQGTALNQPRSLPLIKNPQGNLGGYLYIPDVVGNYAEGPSVTIGSNETWEGELDMVITQWGAYVLPMGGGVWASGFGLIFRADSQFRVFSKGNPTSLYVSNSVNLGTSFNVKYGYNGTEIYADINGVREYTATPNSQSGSITHNLQLNQQATITHEGNYAIQKAKLTVNSAVVFNCDFNGSTSIRHGDTKFQASVGGPVVLNQSGNDPATVIKKSVLRFDGVNDFMNGLFNQTITDGYMFAAFSVLGDGGEVQSRIFSMNSTGALEYEAGGFDLRRNSVDGSNLEFRYNGASAATLHQDVMDDSLGDILFEHQFQNGAQVSKLNNANEANGTTSVSGVLSSEEFRIAALKDATSRNGAFDLEYLALFPATITDAQADSVRNYINNRNNVFSLIDSQGYYFFDPQIFPIVDPADFVSYWNGNIVGSDLTLNASVSQSVVNDRPTRDGYKITFNDNADRLVVASPLSGGQAGWQVVGTSLGTFVYRVNANAVTELNLLGNAGLVRTAGDSYGIMLLPESATGADIEQARSLLIDRGAADSSANVDDFWRTRSDIVEFNFIDTSNATSFVGAWRECSSLLSFPSIDASSGVYFNNAWKSCSALTSFPAGAKLGTSANNVNFTSAWQSSGLTSFPALDLSKGTNFASTWNSTPLSSFGAIDASSATSFYFAWNNTSSLTSFPSGAKLGTAAANVDFTSAWQQGGLTSFSTPLPTAKSFQATWFLNSSLVDFSADVLTNWNPASIVSGVFNLTWNNCPLTAQSVENILTSIDASGKYATSTGASGGSALGDAGIDIDYNTGTGSLSAATNTAVTSLKAKGWSIIVNNVTL